MGKKIEFSKKEQRVTLFRLLSYSTPYFKKVILAFILLSMAVLGEITGPILIKIFIDDYLTPRNLPLEPLILLAGGYLGIQLLKSLITYFQQYTFQEIALNIIQQIRVDVFTKVQALGLKYFDKTPAGSIVSRVTNDTEAIKELFVTVLSSFIQSGFLLAGIFVAMFTLNVQLAVYCLIIVPLILIIMKTYRKYSAHFYADMRERLGQLNAKMNESLQGMAMIQMFRQQKRLEREFSKINEKHYLAGKRNIKLDSLLLRPAVDIVYIGSLIMVLSYFGVTSFNSPVEVGVVYAFTTYLNRFFKPVNEMMKQLSTYQQAIISAGRVFQLLDEREVAPKQSDIVQTKMIDGKIEFNDVSFSYDGKKDVLKHISFTVKPGETVALVGHTGSGKSSIINLLMRFYDFKQGEILIDGVSIKDYSLDKLREKMGLVLQDPFLFYGTVKDNIRLHNDKLTDEKVREAAEFVQAHHFIERLENGYAHRVVERGSTFSSGQRQLIAFARTIATDPKVLILDEATANIDTETEEEIQAALAKMRKGRSTIAIAHRLSTIQDADLILVLHQGSIVERGTHQELLAQKGLYYQMYQLQNGLVVL
nr:ABC transporter transmembrane domain-containing protein [uncultured Bacillus sp.]